MNEKEKLVSLQIQLSVIDDRAFALENEVEIFMGEELNERQKSNSKAIIVDNVNALQKAIKKIKEKGLAPENLKKDMKILESWVGQIVERCETLDSAVGQKALLNDIKEISSRISAKVNPLVRRN